ncbi:hypothetical protein LOTGIDRAFT_238595 [Lottia gigantea]|uniref:D-isomer specific 2-hydroxyacid dehydrogenase NAD-binding domain-containing protein n=1 Tax=Lottia gigantea TaxID=225164 RepID=V4ASQ2_LOTGI|nr:hypothetical protein LOTGIDRAFT_238595 [Lottia gigantea]ESP00308.1 hypothetical protein LOTGIDRAFT_238595 [Lottia gigantea]
MASTNKPVGKVLYIASVVPDLLRHVQKLLPNVAISQINNNLFNENQVTNELKSELKDAEMLVADPPLISQLLYESSLPLKVVNSTWAGIDAIIKNLDKSKGYPKFTLTRMGHGFGEIMGEYVIGHIIATERRFKDTYQYQSQHQWAQQKLKSFRPLSSLNIGILGLGQIGNTVSKYCKSLGLTVIGIKRRESKSASQYIDQYGYVEELENILPSCDYICSILPSTPDTRNLLSGQILSCCSQRKPVLINIGRGDVIDEQTIITAIQNKWLSGAILDVFVTEPLSESSPAWDLPNVTITPHVSGPSLSQQVAECIADNYNRYIQGDELQYQVNWQRGY